MKSKTGNYVRWAVLFAYAGLIFLGSSRPLPAEYIPRIPHIDKAMHFVAYGILAMLSFRALWPDAEAPVPAWVLVLGAALATVYGAADEFHQVFVPTRAFSFFDMAANGAGAAVAAALWEPLGRRYRWLR